jgi:hypothetical protein
MPLMPLTQQANKLVVIYKRALVYYRELSLREMRQR